MSPTPLATRGLDTSGPVRECTKYDPDVMFPDDKDAVGVAAAKAVCAACAVFAECRREVLDKGCPPFGVWAGISEGERNAPTRTHKSSMRKKQRTRKRAAEEAEGQYELAFGGAA